MPSISMTRLSRCSVNYEITIRRSVEHDPLSHIDAESNMKSMPVRGSADAFRQRCSVEHAVGAVAGQSIMKATTLR
eukprot:3566043-Rhodomonas_salina.1